MQTLRIIPAVLVITAGIAIAVWAGGASDSWVEGDWRLTEIDGAPFAAETTLRIEADGVSGKAPCNSYRGDRSGEYPTITISQLVSTKMACPDLGLESTYLNRLEAVTGGKIDGERLTLTDGKGGSLVFQATPR